MLAQITRSLDEPIREGLTTNDRFGGSDHGLIWCWEQGRQMATEGHLFHEQALRCELPQLITWRRGTLNYYALWLGIRGEDLEIDRDEGFAIQCSNTKRWWVFGQEEKWKEKLQQWLDKRYLERTKKEQ